MADQAKQHSDQTTNIDVVNDDGSSRTKLIGQRHLQVFLLFVMGIVAYAMRVNVSVALVAITNRNSSNSDFDEYNWNGAVQSYILSSFFWGYIVMQLPAALIVSKYGVKYFLCGTMAFCGFLNIITPFLIPYGGWQVVCFLRALQGLSQGFLYPSVHNMLSLWAPIEERGRLATFAYAGTNLGTVFMLGTSGFLASSPFGWPSIFYVSGFISIAWALLWFFVGSNSPAESKSISNAERLLIQTSLGSTRTDEKAPPMPWKRAFSSVPFIALICVHCSQNWGFWTLLTEIPLYLKNVYDLDIKSNALVSALPYFIMWLLSFLFSPISDIIINKKLVTRTTSRKIFNTIGIWGPMIALILLGTLPNATQELAIALLTIAVGLNAGTFVGFIVNHIDLSPNHAGTLMAITNFISNIMSIIAPLAVGVIVQDQSDPMQWKTVFLVASGFYLVGNGLFIAFGQAEVQPWNVSNKRNY